VGGAPHPGPNGMKAYRWVDFNCVFYGDTALVPFVADVDSEYNGHASHSQLRIVDYYVKLNGSWIQAGSDTQASPKSIAARGSEPGQLPPQLKTSLLDTRERVWKAYFANDRAYLDQTLPAELIAIDPGASKYSTKESILDGAARFAQGGSKLTKIDFADTEIRVYGSVAEVYSAFELTFESPRGTSREKGHASETFVFRNGNWINTAWHLDSQSPSSPASAGK
jgi:hypothetical protein